MKREVLSHEEVLEVELGEEPEERREWRGSEDGRSEGHLEDGAKAIVAVTRELLDGLDGVLACLVRRGGAGSEAHKGLEGAALDDDGPVVGVVERQVAQSGGRFFAGAFGYALTVFGGRHHGDERRHGSGANDLGGGRRAACESVCHAPRRRLPM